ncbi:type II toxin-antitoxin system RelE/ParE family toxin [Luteolibacter soli]|uniref:Toxin n=1 Tax=Luteolibacter soli TaxID=3135280 RepID=A0ABU9APZ5_9BACT
MRLDLSPAAVADLGSIADYTFEHWGSEQEEDYLGGIWNLLERIAAKPDAFRSRSEFGRDCRSAKCRRHVIFFIAQPDRIEVLRVLHGSMDFGSHLPEDLM